MEYKMYEDQYTKVIIRCKKKLTPDEQICLMDETIEYQIKKNIKIKDEKQKTIYIDA